MLKAGFFTSDLFRLALPRGSVQKHKMRLFLRNRDALQNCNHGVVILEKALIACFDHFVSCDMGEIHAVSGTIRQNFDKQSLRSAISFPKGVNGIQLAEIKGKPLRNLA